MLLPSQELAILIFNFFFNKFKSYIKNTANREVQKTFKDKKFFLLQDNKRN